MENDIRSKQNIPNYEKLIKSYELSASHEEKFESKHWKERNEIKRAQFFNLLNKNIKSLEEFRKDKFLSKGLDDAVDTQNIPSAFFKLAEKHGAERCLNFFQERNVGQSDKSIYLFKKFIDYHEIFLVDYAIKLEDYFFKEKEKEKPIICEIGGGYGALARMITSNQNCKYILIDLPETNILSSYYLEEHFNGTDKKILHFCDLDKSLLSAEDIQSFDIIIIPPSVEFAENLFVDLFINTRSFMEMNLSTVEKYFNLIQTNISSNGFFLNINRYHKSTSNEANMIAHYPYDLNWMIISSEKAFMQDWIHLLLTKRVNEVNQHFCDELKYLKEYSNKHITSPSKKLFFNLLSMISRIIPPYIKHLIKRLITTQIPE